MHGTRESASFVVSTNIDGLRSHATRARSPGVARVMLAGDSTVFGWGVDDGGTVADGLAAGLRARGLGVEVINAGQPGYSTSQVERFFSTVGQLYQPDLLVVFIPMHDDNRVLVSDREVLEGASGLGAIRVGLAQHSRLYQALRQAIFPLSGEAALVPGVHESAEPRVPRVSDRERDENMDRLRAALGKGRLAVGHLPFKGDLDGEDPPRFSIQWARDYEAATGTPVLDLRSCCKGVAQTLPNDPGHLTAAGNVAVGEAAAEAVAALISGSKR